MARTKQASEGRIEAPADLPAGASAVWAGIVDALPRDFFGPQDTRLLAQYCHAAWRASLEIKRDKRKAGTADMQVVKDCAGIVKALGAQLRLAPSSRIDAERAGSARRRARSELRRDAEAATDWRAALPGRLDS